MIVIDHLTKREKIMHAKKVGIVSCAGKFFKNAETHCIAYTLCEIATSKEIESII
jgi:hypothetical protein